MGSGGTGKCPKRGTTNDGSVVAPILAPSYTLEQLPLGTRWLRGGPGWLPTPGEGEESSKSTEIDPAFARHDLSRLVCSEALTFDLI